MTFDAVIISFFALVLLAAAVVLLADVRELLREIHEELTWHQDEADERCPPQPLTPCYMCDGRASVTDTENCTWPCPVCQGDSPSILKRQAS